MIELLLRRARSALKTLQTGSSDIRAALHK
jgi:hypothetical protein